VICGLTFCNNTKVRIPASCINYAIIISIVGVIIIIIIQQYNIEIFQFRKHVHDSRQWRYQLQSVFCSYFAPKSNYNIMLTIILPYTALIRNNTKYINISTTISTMTSKYLNIKTINNVNNTTTTIIIIMSIVVVFNNNKYFMS